MAPAALGLAFIAAAGYSHVATTSFGAISLVSALKNQFAAGIDGPLALLDERSPGGRGDGPLQMTKSGNKPHERVLSEVREHSPTDSAPGTSPPAAADDAPPSATTPNATPATPGQANTAPTSFSPFNAPFGTPGIFAPAANNLASTPGNDNPPNTISNPGNATASSPSDGPAATTAPDVLNNPADPPSNNSNNFGTPPSTTNQLPSGDQSTSLTDIPEPASWTMLAFGLLVFSAIRHRKQRRHMA